MTVVFNNTLFAAGFVGEDDGAVGTRFQPDNISTTSVTVTGTVNAVGDTIMVTGVLPDNDETGLNTTPTSVTTLYASQFDNSGMIAFSTNPNPSSTAAGTYKFLLSNSTNAPLVAGTRYVLAADPTFSTYQVCFARGTQIRTASGDAAVEDLAIGDLAVTASGAHRPIRWIGRRAYSGVFANRNPGMLPIRFAAGSLGDNVPCRELCVSPKHAMVLDGMLVPAEHLVNGTSITRTQRVESLEYFHVELDSHDVLIAEGAATESYVEDDNRDFFHNAAAYRAANPEAVSREASYCLPRVEAGFALEAIRLRLDAISANLHWAERAS